eukprot:1137595-Pelagomonas_calceolata.AAC.4
MFVRACKHLNTRVCVYVCACVVLAFASDVSASPASCLQSLVGQQLGVDPDADVDMDDGEEEAEEAQEAEEAEEAGQVRDGVSVEGGNG